MQILHSHPELEALGLTGLEKVYWQLHSPQLYEQAVRRYEGMVSHLGPLVVRTGNLMHHSMTWRGAIPAQR
jgi:phosphoenolpyruvate carboxykinase (ATP)